ncbi:MULTISPECIES: enoyl-CoA hydratase/isomerase family protein [Pseudomonas]|uniref:Fatty acid oxidation complex subunit alpha n=1 Tax=Pseudomonas fluorescens TaxID=294 RepID=A0A5E7JJW0_PSEFL|nr:MULTISPECIES: enoyl-CoA hydratase/isomerase family protein [Pseudomonas]VVO88194.1 Fatty acid oxidation complex subunit alpha [Pseudomonas fluorescens]
MKSRRIVSATLAFSMLLGGSTLAGQALAADTATSPPKSASSSPNQFLIEKVSPEYWRVQINNPPFNIYGPDSTFQFEKVVNAIENDTKLKVVVFESKVPGFFLTHYDFAEPLERTLEMPNGKTGLPPLPDMLVRLSKSPVVSIAMINGRASGVGSELALASDMRFASDKAVLSQFEIGAGFVPGGGPMARLPRLIGRGRALEVLLSGNDIDGKLAERYGYVNRSFPENELNSFVDALARRIATFDKQSLGEIKELVNVASLPSNEDIGKEWPAFLNSVRRPAAQHHIGRLMQLGLQQKADVEINLPKYTGQVSAEKN